MDEASDFARSFAYWNSVGWKLESPHWDDSYGCTQTFMQAVAGKPDFNSQWKAFKNASGQNIYHAPPPVRRGWLPIVPTINFAVPAKSPGSASSPIQTACPVGYTWNVAQGQCVKKYFNPCPKGQHLLNGKCVSSGSSSFQSPSDNEFLLRGTPENTMSNAISLASHDERAYSAKRLPRAGLGAVISGLADVNTKMGGTGLSGVGLGDTTTVVAPALPTAVGAAVGDGIFFGLIGAIVGAVMGEKNHRGEKAMKYGGVAAVAGAAFGAVSVLASQPAVVVAKTT